MCKNEKFNEMYDFKDPEFNAFNQTFMFHFDNTVNGGEHWYAIELTNVHQILCEMTNLRDLQMLRL